MSVRVRQWSLYVSESEAMELVCQRERGNGACMSVRVRQWSLYVSESEAMELVCQ